MKGSLVSAQVVEPYAEALMSVAQSQNLVEQFGAEIRALLDLLANSRELREFIENPVIKAEDKKAVLRRLSGEATSPYLTNFLLLLVDRRRIMFVDAIGEKYLELLRKLKNTVLAAVTSASELSESQRQALADKVKQMTNAESVELSINIDPSLLGGVIIKVGSQVLDASLRGQLRRISLSLGI